MESCLRLFQRPSSWNSLSHSSNTFLFFCGVRNRENGCTCLPIPFCILHGRAFRFVSYPTRSRYRSRFRIIKATVSAIIRSVSGMHVSEGLQTRLRSGEGASVRRGGTFCDTGASIWRALSGDRCPTNVCTRTVSSCRCVHRLFLHGARPVRAEPLQNRSFLQVHPSLVFGSVVIDNWNPLDRSSRSLANQNPFDNAQVTALSSGTAPLSVTSRRRSRLRG